METGESKQRERGKKTKAKKKREKEKEEERKTNLFDFFKSLLPPRPNIRRNPRPRLPLFGVVGCDVCD